MARKKEKDFGISGVRKKFLQKESSIRKKKSWIEFMRKETWSLLHRRGEADGICVSVRLQRGLRSKKEKRPGSRGVPPPTPQKKGRAR